MPGGQQNGRRRAASAGAGNGPRCAGGEVLVHAGPQAGCMQCRRPTPPVHQRTSHSRTPTRRPSAAACDRAAKPAGGRGVGWDRDDRKGNRGGTGGTAARRTYGGASDARQSGNASVPHANRVMTTGEGGRAVKAKRRKHMSSALGTNARSAENGKQQRRPRRKARLHSCAAGPTRPLSSHA